MNRKSKFINYQGELFWPDHLRDLKVIRFVVSAFIDFIKEKMHSPELAIFISGIYMLGLNVQLMGIYSSFSLCEAYIPVDYYVPEFLLLDSTIAIYVSHYYFLAYLGNLQNSPYFITFACALFGFYQFTLTFVDLLHCLSSDLSFVLGGSMYIYAYCKCFICLIIIVHWLVILIKPKWIGYIQILPYIGAAFKSLFLSTCKCKFLSEIYAVVKRPLEYPLRVKTAVTISFGLTLTSNLAVLVAIYGIYDFIDILYGYRNYLSSQSDDYIFVMINTEYPIAIYMKQGIDLLDFLIYVLLPIYPSLVVALGLGLAIVSVSIISLLYQYKKIIYTIRDEGDRSDTLKFIWKFSSHSSINFCSQFVLNSVFLNFIFAFSIFIICYVISFRETYIFLFNYIITRQAEFWIGLIPVFLGIFYFPRLRNQHNFIRNYKYFCFWDTWYFLIGTIGAFLKAAVRYLIGFGATVVLGYRVHRSIMPDPLQKIDTLYVGFYSTIVVHCLREGLIPREVKEELELYESFTGSINI